MLIPFPNPPSIRKVPDDIFEHIANAIDPPEVIVDVTPRPAFGGGFGGGGDWDCWSFAGLVSAAL
jgi:hypothetical protein